MKVDRFLTEKKWTLLSESEREVLISKMVVDRTTLSEDRWWNTVGDIIGIFDPTGIVDFANGIDYIRQGDYLFGFLSLVSAVPYVGDALAKPVLGALKIGKGTTKALNAALKLAKAGKEAEAVAKIAAVGKTAGIEGKFVTGVGKWGDTLINMVNKIPGGRVSAGLKRTIIEWVHLFQQGAKSGRNIARGSRRLTSSWKGLSQAEKIANLEKLIKASKGTGLFKGYKAVEPKFWGRWIVGGVPRVWEAFTKSERSVRSLMRRTKWYLGLLDRMGLANFVGPEELEAKYGKDEILKQIEEYNKTEQANKNWLDDFGGGDKLIQSTQQSTTQQPVSTGSSDPILSMFDFIMK
jgi:hypothetical protein